MSVSSVCPFIIVCSFYLMFSLHLLSDISGSPAQFAHFLVPLHVFILLTSLSSESDCAAWPSTIGGNTQLSVVLIESFC